MTHETATQCDAQVGRLRGPKRAAETLICLALLVFASGCGWLKGTVNASPGLRWWLFSTFGAGRICPEMLKQGVSLKLAAGQNTIGRFFPTWCQHQVNEAQRTINVDFAGTGYAWTPIAGRVGFSAEAGVEYRMDFQMADDAIYIWGQPVRVTRGPDFKIGAVENKLVNWAAHSPVGYLANTFGGQIMSSQVATGFTVVHLDEGDEFALGRLYPPQRPPRPFDTSDGERFVFANETTEVRPEQVDFLGPFEVPDTDQALFLRFRVQGPAIDVFVLQRGTADLWREQLQLGGALGPPPNPPLTLWTIQPGGEQRRKIALPRGQYSITLDNSSRAGTVNPPWNPLSMVGANAAIVSYTAELGEADDPF
jgi:hypothetical protein